MNSCIHLFTTGLYHIKNSLKYILFTHFSKFKYLSRWLHWARNTRKENESRHTAITALKDEVSTYSLIILMSSNYKQFNSEPRN